MSVANVVTFCALVILWLSWEVEAAVCDSEGEIVGFMFPHALWSELETGVKWSADVLFLFPHKRKHEAREEGG